MKLFVDSREPKDIINLLESRVNIETGNLDVGDFLIKNECLFIKQEVYNHLDC